MKLIDHNHAAWIAPAAAAPAPGDPVMLNMADVAAEPVEWLWPGRIPLGKITLISGDPGGGKSFLSADLAARVSAGLAWPDLPGEPNAAGGVVLMSAEDDPGDTIRPRLDACGADCSRVELLKGAVGGDGGERFVSLQDLSTIRSAVARTPGCRLLVVDPIASYLVGADHNSAGDVRTLLDPLVKLAAEFRVAVVLIAHLNKGAGSRAIHRTSGSMAIPAVARSAWVLVKDREDEDRRLWLCTKMSCAREPDGMAFTLEGSPARVRWSDQIVSLTAEDALAPPGSEDRTKTEEAAEWLHDQLASGPVEATELDRRARDAGIARSTLKRAKKLAGAGSVKTATNGPWVWRLGEGDQQGPKGTRGPGVVPFGSAGPLRIADGPDTPEWARQHGASLGGGG